MVAFWLFFANVIFSGQPENITAGQCEISVIYTTVDLPDNAKVLTQNGSFSTVSLLLKPTELAPGEYEYSLTRRATNLYKVENTSMYIETKLCFNIGFEQASTIIINNPDGFVKGTVIFK